MQFRTLALATTIGSMALFSGSCPPRLYLMAMHRQRNLNKRFWFNHLQQIAAKMVDDMLLFPPVIEIIRLAVQYCLLTVSKTRPKSILILIHH